MNRRPPRTLPTRAHHAAILLAALVASTSFAATAAAQVPDDTGPDQTIDADQAEAAGPATLDLGHVDLGPRFVDGTWTFMVHDDTVDPSVWRSFDDVVIRVLDEAAVEVPDDERYDFLDLDAGTSVHVIPQTQDADVVWLGWNTQDPEVIERVDRGITMSLVGLEGPGELTVYLQAGVMEPPDVLWRSTDTEPRPLFIDLDTHTHANWLFSEPGAYLARIRVTAELIDGTTVDDTATVRFAVGDGTDVDAARTAAYTGTDATAPPEGGTGDDETAASPQEDSSVPTPAIAAGLLAMVLAAAVAVGAVRASRTKRAASHTSVDGSTPAGP